MRALLTLSSMIDQLNKRLGRWLSWLLLLAVVISSANAVVRKLFDVSSNAYLDLQWLLFGAVFLLCSPWTLMENEHIRVDILNNLLSQRKRQWVDLFGHIFFLMPFAAVMLWYSVPFFLASFRIGEQSMNAGGLPQWPAKLLIVIAAVLLLLQGISEIFKTLAALFGSPQRAGPETKPE